MTISGEETIAGIDNSELSKFYLMYYYRDYKESSSSPRSLNFFVSYVILPVAIFFTDLFTKSWDYDGNSSSTEGITLVYCYSYTFNSLFDPWMLKKGSLSRSESDSSPCDVMKGW